MKTLITILLISISFLSFGQYKVDIKCKCLQVVEYNNKTLAITSKKVEPHGFVLDSSQIVKDKKETFKVTDADFDVTKQQTFYHLKDKNTFVYEFSKKRLTYTTDTKMIQYRDCKLE